MEECFTTLVCLNMYYTSIGNPCGIKAPRGLKTEREGFILKPT